VTVTALVVGWAGVTCAQEGAAPKRYRCPLLANAPELDGDVEGDPECAQLVDEFNRMSWGHYESTGMRFCMLTRAWALDAALGCGGNAATVEYAEAIRAAIRDILRCAPGW